jgi:integrase
VWDRAAGKPRKTKRFALIREARNAREDLERQVREGKLPTPTGPRLGDAIERFVGAARDGVALNKWGRRYRPRAWRDLESALRHVPDRLRRKRLDEVRRGDIQRLVDELAERGLSGSRTRSVVHAIHSLYRWAQDRELASSDPAALVRLPVMAAVPRDRVASPAEFAGLLSPLELKDALPFALAGYATARHQEIRTLDWTHVHLELGAVELAGDEEGRKPGGSWRIVPLVAPLRSLLRRAWLEQGRPRSGKVCPPRKRSQTGLLSLDHLQERVRERWRKLGLDPIGLHEARHTASTWLDHAGVSPKVASQLMGHKTPEYQPGAAPITLRRYTHVLPGELERAREQLDRFLAERTREKSQRSFGPPDGPPRR